MPSLVRARRLSILSSESLFRLSRLKPDAVAEGKPILTELRKEEAALRKEIDLEDKDTAVPKSHIDDEYANAAQSDPKIFLTTSRDPSQPLIQFTKELKFVFPNAERVSWFSGYC